MSMYYKHVKLALYYETQQNPYIKLNKNIKNPYSSTIYPYLNINNKSKKKEGFKLEIEWKQLKTHTFSWRLREDWKGKWRFFEWKWQFWERERRRRQRGLHMMRGKLKSFWKTVWDLTLFMQNTHFSRLIWLASKSPKSLVQDFEKFL